MLLDQSLIEPKRALDWRPSECQSVSRTQMKLTVLTTSSTSCPFCSTSSCCRASWERYFGTPLVFQAFQGCHNSGPAQAANTWPHAGGHCQHTSWREQNESLIEPGEPSRNPAMLASKGNRPQGLWKAPRSCEQVAPHNPRPTQVKLGTLGSPERGVQPKPRSCPDAAPANKRAVLS